MLNPKLIQLAACSSPLSCVDWPSPRRAAPIAERHHSIAILHPCRRRQQARQRHAPAAQGRSISPSLAFHGVRAVLIRLLSWLPALFLISLSLNFIFYLRTQEPSKQTTRTIQNPRASLHRFQIPHTRSSLTSLAPSPAPQNRAPAVARPGIKDSPTIRPPWTAHPPLTIELLAPAIIFFV